MVWCFLLVSLLSCESAKDSSDGGIFMKVKVVSLEQCSATERTISLVNEVAKDLGVAINLEHIIVRTLQEAVVHRHIGSPTVQINDLDIEPGARQVNQFGLT